MVCGIPFLFPRLSLYDTTALKGEGAQVWFDQHQGNLGKGGFLKHAPSVLMFRSQQFLKNSQPSLKTLKIATVCGIFFVGTHGKDGHHFRDPFGGWPFRVVAKVFLVYPRNMVYFVVISRHHQKALLFQQPTHDAVETIHTSEPVVMMVSEGREGDVL